MMQKFQMPTFDSRDARYKRPYGAVPAGTAVELTLRPPRAAGYSRATLYARMESNNNTVRELEMPWTDFEGDRDLFCCTLETGGYVGLIWYSFVLEGIDGRREAIPERQLTVYDGSETVPAWFGEGVTYQIFPDRFRRQSVPDPAGMVGGRWVHQNWEDEPEWRPDHNGEIRNRDFFGGSLAGVMEQLPYLKSLGVDTLYFNPIFEAAENHRYGTGDYSRVDPMLGTNEDFRALCGQAHAMGMRVILDGVFNHTGYVSKYFNGDGSYGDGGAARRQDSPYYDWYSFSHWPDRYESWWGIYSLPAVRESEPSYVDYIIESEDSVVRSWLRAGADGWRLDVADELPDGFIEKLHAAVRAEKPDGVVIGEVWEDGSNKIAYDVRRKHILGRHCDGLMNYPFRNALLGYLLGGGAEGFREQMEQLRENYPRFAFYSAMNSLGTHDTPRILTLLGLGSDGKDQSREWRAGYRMTPEERERGVRRLRLGAMVLFAFPGSPTIYYGDEAGMEGFEDPFNRRTFPWGREDKALTGHFAALSAARHAYAPLRRGDLHYAAARGGLLAFTRSLGMGTVLCAVNAGERKERLDLPWYGKAVDCLTGERLEVGPEGLSLELSPLTGRLIASG